MTVRTGPFSPFAKCGGTLHKLLVTVVRIHHRRTIATCPGGNDRRTTIWAVATLAGAVVAVGCWIALSYYLGKYFRDFANFNKTYGTLGAAIALMVWLYWTGFAMLVGAS